MYLCSGFETFTLSIFSFFILCLIHFFISLFFSWFLSFFFVSLIDFFILFLITVVIGVNAQRRVSDDETGERGSLMIKTLAEVFDAQAHGNHLDSLIKTVKSKHLTITHRNALEFYLTDCKHLIYIIKYSVCDSGWNNNNIPFSCRSID